MTCADEVLDKDNVERPGVAALSTIRSARRRRRRPRPRPHPPRTKAIDEARNNPAAAARHGVICHGHRGQQRRAGSRRRQRPPPRRRSSVRGPGVKVRVVDSSTLMDPEGAHPHGMRPAKFAQLFTGTVDVIPVARLPPGGDPPARAGPGPGTGVEQGTATTPFDVTVGSTVSGYHLVMYAVNNARRLPREAVGVLEWCGRRRIGREVSSCFSSSC